MAADKSEGPMTALVYLSIAWRVNYGSLTASFRGLRLFSSKWGTKRVCRRRELESLIDLLNHACKVVRPGRSFLRRLIDLLHQTG